MMGKLVLFFLGWLLLKEAASAQQYDGFEYMKLALQWPASHCQLNSCKATPPSYFTIHGLWPDNYTGKGLYNCYDQPYVTITDEELLQKLKKSWPDIATKKENKLWQHEWTKHGTCSLSLYDQTAYFKKALELNERYKLIDHLQSNGVSPGDNAYAAQTIISIVEKLTGAVPDVECEKEKKSEKQFLHEIRICFVPGTDKAANCPEGRGTPQCTGEAYFPQAPSNALYLPA